MRTKKIMGYVIYSSFSNGYLNKGRCYSDSETGEYFAPFSDSLIHNYGLLKIFKTPSEAKKRMVDTRQTVNFRDGIIQRVYEDWTTENI